MPIEQYIFRSFGPDEVSVNFLEKLDQFNLFFIEKTLVYGDANNASFEGVDVVYDQNYSSNFYQVLISKILNYIPLSTIRFEINNTLNTYCEIFYLDGDEQLDGFYMTENFNEQELFEHNSYQIHKIRDVSMQSINNFWLE